MKIKSKPTTGKPIIPRGDQHRSDCAVHNGPAYPGKPCDCFEPQIARFIHDAPFAKIVETSQGDALNIGGVILHIEGPKGVDWAVVISRGLRRMNAGTRTGGLEWAMQTEAEECGPA